MVRKAQEGVKTYNKNSESTKQGVAASPTSFIKPNIAYG